MTTRNVVIRRDPRIDNALHEAQRLSTRACSCTRIVGRLTTRARSHLIVARLGTERCVHARHALRLAAIDTSPVEAIVPYVTAIRATREADQYPHDHDGLSHLFDPPRGRNSTVSHRLEFKSSVSLSRARVDRKLHSRPHPAIDRPPQHCTVTQRPDHHIHRDPTRCPDGAFEDTSTPSYDQGSRN